MKEWAVVSAANFGVVCSQTIRRRRKICYFDGCMDHANESIYSEYFVASLIAYSFVYSDIDRIIRLATEQVPQESKFRLMLETVSSWCDETSHPDALREKLSGSSVIRTVQMCSRISHLSLRG
ncbi:MAG: ADP-ribosylglycohydrolase family protein [Candidatus Borkfalkia sp.]